MGLICGGCNKRNDRDGLNCTSCLLRRKEKRDQHRALGCCTYPKCFSPRTGGTKTCKLHREMYRKRNAKKYAKEKEERRARRLATMSFAKLLQDFDAVL